MFKAENLTKRYDGFVLDGVSFSIPRGYIVGFIGTNGAGKTTTLKSMLGVIKPDGGWVTMDGLSLRDDEQELKSKVALSLGQFDYYAYERAEKVARHYKEFFPAWSDEKFNFYMEKFSLDGKKKIREFSAGMKVKFSLALALAHDAELFVFDEPTSGLDPIARDEVLQVFQEIVENGDKSIIYSTHITSDLDKCADYILFIDGGKILLNHTLESVLSSHTLVTGKTDDEDAFSSVAIAVKKNKYSVSALVMTKDAGALDGEKERPNLEDIMIYYTLKNRGQR